MSDKREYPEMSNDRLLHRDEVLEMSTLSESTIYRLMSAGKFPRPIRIGPRAVRWRLSAILHYLESCPEADPSASQ